MKMRLELDTPPADEYVSFGELSLFIEKAKSIGAKPETPVKFVAAREDTEIIVALRVEVDGGFA